MNSGVIENAIKLLGEVNVVPGTSQLLDGNMKSGVAHVLVGMTACYFFGVPAMLLVAASSFSQSVSHKSLYTHVTDAMSSVETSKPAEAPRESED